MSMVKMPSMGRPRMPSMGMPSMPSINLGEIGGGAKDWVGDRWNDVTGVTGDRAARDAANAQIQFAEKGLQENRRQFDTSRADMMPWMESGRSHLGRMDELMGQGYFDMQDADLEGPAFSYDMQTDPGYQFRVGQATDAIKRASAARGNRFTPGMFAELSDRIGGMASDEFDRGYNRQYGQHIDQYNQRVGAYGRRAGNLQDQFNRLSGLANAGQQQSSALGNLGGNFAANQANLYGQQGAARAGGILGQANARLNSPLNQGITQAISMAPYMFL